jgi:hypothetical protein
LWLRSDGVCAASKGAVFTSALDVGVVILPHRRRGKECVVSRRRHFAVGVVDRLKLHHRLVVAGAVDAAASRNLGAGERRKVQLALIFNINGFRFSPCPLSKSGCDQKANSKHVAASKAQANP